MHNVHLHVCTHLVAYLFCSFPLHVHCFYLIQNMVLLLDITIHGTTVHSVKVELVNPCNLINSIFREDIVPRALRAKQSKALRG